MKTLKALETEKTELLQKVNSLRVIKKLNYSNMDVESPMSKEEKKLNSNIAAVYSRLNQIVKEKWNLAN